MFNKFITWLHKLIGKKLLIIAIVSTLLVCILYTASDKNIHVLINHHSRSIWKNLYSISFQKYSSPESWIIQNNSTLQDPAWKIVVYLDPWYGNTGSFETLNMTAVKCPEQRCIFTDDAAALPYAHVVLFGYSRLPYARERKWHPEQKWACGDVEVPVENRVVLPDTCDWWLSYSQDGDIPSGYYGYFLPINYTVRPIFANILSESSPAYVGLQAALASGASLASVINKSLVSHFTKKPKMVAWMSSHCPVESKRMDFVKELQNYIQVDTYGKCGTRSCFKRHALDPFCWQQILSKYSFYLAMENTLCEEYITEKVYMPMLHGLVPIVYGGANYSRYLPPHSYIDASSLGVTALAKLLTDLHNDPRKLERYHLWRGFYEVHPYSNLCDFCVLLHDAAWLSQRRLPPNEARTNAKSKCRQPPESFKDPW